MGRFVLGNTLGFCSGFDYSNHSLDTSVIAEDDSGMQVGFWYDMGVSPSQLASPESIGREAAEGCGHAVGKEFIYERMFRYF